ncbi:hypothetical protein PENTCL1PPCAC_23517, partial [Pristionchus entomophagus]
QNRLFPCVMSSGGENDHKEAVDPDVIRMKVENMKNSANVKLKVKNIKGFPWQLQAFYTHHGHMNVLITCKNSDEYEMWKCEAKWQVKLVNQIDYSLSVCQIKECVFDSWDDSSMLIFLNVIKNENIVTDGSVEVEAKIIDRKENGERFRKRPQIDFFSKSNFSDVIFVVEGKKLHASKQILANASSYFKTLFFGDFKDSQVNEIELEDVTVEDFLVALKLVYDTGKIDDSNVEFLLKMADRFDIPTRRFKVVSDARHSLHGSL